MVRERIWIIALHVGQLFGKLFVLLLGLLVEIVTSAPMGSAKLDEPASWTEAEATDEKY